ncbi:carbohydrate kinase family protein, partial [Maribacter flavus]|uniref:carbohydrate kinase family protein n=1 Tax=Maribacter flavus TaxID=1658664 RepID=UPI003D351DC5
LDEACAFLHDTGVAIIVLTLGKEGTLLSTKHFRITIPSIEVTPVDTTGAGDGFIGCMLKQISEHDRLQTLLQSE